MTSTMKWLTGVLIAQLLLAVGVYTQQAHRETTPPSGPLLTFTPDSVTEFDITGSNNQSVTIVRRPDGGWILPGLNNLPADKQLLDEALSHLAGQHEDWPVTQTASAHERFRVADNDFERRLEVKSGGDSAVLLLGDSPAYRKVYGRLPGQDPVYSLALNSVDFPLHANRWLDKSLLAVNDVSSVKRAEYQLQQQGDQWQLQAEGNILAAADAPRQQLLKVLSELRVTGVADLPPPAEATVTEISVQSGEQLYRYRFAHDDSHYWVSRADLAPTFTMGQYQFAQIVDTGVADLQAVPAAEVPAATAPAPDTTSPGSVAPTADVHS
ncbi:DUF4340 domain-containing protein [Halioxenophilus sp. WMMB6]|uniref:DUF4340 domain-containing protein n=1 Tax=Halioxenophilus sp. WMMB6 TaxID=3073815 RepID=UPI00295EB0DC|nr:DUF4340 domain-containing protein [Halioxenophilus sp. WMMB6]